MEEGGKFLFTVYICICLDSFQASLVAQMVKNLPVIQEIQVQSLGREDPLEKGLATHSSILEFHGQRSLVDYSPWSFRELDMIE